MLKLDDTVRSLIPFHFTAEHYFFFFFDRSGQRVRS